MMVLICISPMMSDIEHLFIVIVSIFSCLLVIHTSSLEKCLFKSCCLFLNKTGFYCWVLEFIYIFLTLIPYQTYDWQIFSLFCGLFFYCVDIILWYMKVFSFCEVLFAYSVFCYSYAIGIIPKKTLPNPMLWRFCPMFSSKGFIVLALTFRSLLHFLINFCIWC